MVWSRSIISHAVYSWSQLVVWSFYFSLFVSDVEAVASLLKRFLGLEELQCRWEQEEEEEEEEDDLDPSTDSEEEGDFEPSVQ